MPNVTITPPSVINVRVEGQSSKVKSINYSPKTLKDSVDVSIAGLLCNQTHRAQPNYRAGFPTPKFA
mgnify:CR=1 FL=1